MKTPALMILATLGLTACSTNMPAGSAVLGPNPTVAGGTYTSPGGISVAAEVRNIGGKTGVCGVWAESESQSGMTRGAAKKVLESGGVSLGSEAVARGLYFMAKVKPATSYAGLQANCITTERAWRAGDEARELRIILPRQMVYGDQDAGFGLSGGFVIWFRPGGPSAHPDDRMPWDPKP